MNAQTWKNLERDTAENFGVQRNIKRGMDFSIKDTDVDVFGEDATCQGLNHNLIIDCKYRRGTEGSLCKTFAEWAKKTPEGYMPIMTVVTDAGQYGVLRLRDYQRAFDTEADPVEYYWHTMVALRKGTKFLDEWFEKLNTVYLPMKAEEFKETPGSIVPCVTLRTSRVRETLIIWQIRSDV